MAISDTVDACVHFVEFHSVFQCLMGRDMHTFALPPPDPVERPVVVVGDSPWTCALVLIPSSLGAPYLIPIPYCTYPYSSPLE